MLTTLVALLPGFPLLLLAAGGAAVLVGYTGAGFRIALMLHNLYLSLPASVFGSGLFPSEEFGYDPTPAGTLIAFGFYALVAIALTIVGRSATGTVCGRRTRARTRP